MAARSTIPAGGRISSGIEPNAFVKKTAKFVEGELSKWRDDNTRPAVEAEEELNGQLCKFLNDSARDNFPMACFHHEEKQGKRRRVDMSVLPSTKAIEATLYDSIYIPFLVIEGKRLPAPAKGREREYLTGLDDRSGGVQRFRLCLHGQHLTVAIIVGYVQQGEVSEWLDRINGWIHALRLSNEDKTCIWTASDCLSSLESDGRAQASRCESIHLRSNADDINLIHLWICIPAIAKKTS